MKSKPYKLNGKTFRYDYDACVVEYLYKASAEDIREEQEWIEKHGTPLFGIDKAGYSVIDAVGLRAENWKNKAARNEYLAEWAWELDENSAFLAEQYRKYEA